MGQHAVVAESGDGPSPSSLVAATAAFSAGKVVVLYDRAAAFLVYAAETADVSATSFAIRHGQGSCRWRCRCSGATNCRYRRP
jgi:3,4-dihydroxy-2-butanone 4-phosphate synthase